MRRADLASDLDVVLVGHGKAVVDRGRRRTPILTVRGKHGSANDTMMAATDGIALNFAFTGKGNDSGPAGLVDQIRAGR
jgi:urease alpha subunit